MEEEEEDWEQQERTVLGIYTYFFRKWASPKFSQFEWYDKDVNSVNTFLVFKQLSDLSEYLGEFWITGLDTPPITTRHRFV